MVFTPAGEYEPLSTLTIDSSSSRNASKRDATRSRIAWTSTARTLARAPAPDHGTPAIRVRPTRRSLPYGVEQRHRTGRTRAQAVGPRRAACGHLVHRRRSDLPKTDAGPRVGGRDGPRIEGDRGRRADVVLGHGDQTRDDRSGHAEPGEPGEEPRFCTKEPSEQRTPRKMDPYLVGETVELARKSFNRGGDEQHIGERGLPRGSPPSGGSHGRR